MKRLKSAAKKWPTEAWRLYERDIPEYPFVVDKYGENAVVWDRGLRVDEENKREEVVEALKTLGFTRVFEKKRTKNEGTSQYEKLSESSHIVDMQEGEFLFKCNLSDYLDTGLFLDHRPLRRWVHDHCKKAGRKLKVLNLFCYTGSISVAAASGGAHVTSVDLSKTYLEWAKDNFRLNELRIDENVFVKEDVFSYLRKCQENFDLIILDPPSFSNSKSMDGILDIQKDQDVLLEKCLRLLTAQGILYFSNNLTSFKLNKRWRDQASDITEKSIPFDFRNQKIHQLYSLQKKQ